MRQVEIPRHGGPEVLRIVERPDPEPGDGEVRVAVNAAGINFADILARMGLYRDAPKPPMVVGYEVAGIIDAVGAGADATLEGQRVLAMTRFGGHSSSVVVPAEAAVPLPDAMPFDEAAALPVVYLTAYHMLYHLGNLHPGERVLIHSAGGGVGLAAIQLARLRGAEIFGTASPGKHERLRELGVHHCIDYHTEDFEKAIQEATGGRGVHIILDAVGGDSFKKSYRSLAKCGRLFCFGVSSFAAGDRRSLLRTMASLARTPFYSPIRFMLDNKGVFGVNLGQLWDEQELVLGHLTTLLELYQEEKISPTVARAFPLEEAAEAHRYIQARNNFGKVVLSPC